MHNMDSDGFTIAGAKDHYPPDLMLCPVHLDISLNINIPEEVVFGNVVQSVRAKTDGHDTIILDAIDFQDLDVSDTDDREITWSYDGNSLRIHWQSPFEKNETRKVRVAYRVEKPIAGMYFRYPTEEYPDNALWVATDHETERARYWLPCIDHPSVRTPLDFHLTATDDLTIIANGLLQEEKLNDNGTKTAHWRLEQRCPSYLVCFAIGDFVEYEDETVKGVAMKYFTARNKFSSEDLARSFKKTPEMMKWLSSKLGTPFPYPKYYQFALEQFGGAMENISITSWDDFAVCNDRVHEEFAWMVDMVNIHEMSHSYFGDTIGSEFGHVWLKESWATYIETVWLEETVSKQDQQYELHNDAVGYQQEADDLYVRPIVTRRYNSSWDLFDWHLYPGGAYRLHMLRQKLGDKTFWGGVRDYIASFSESVAETADFRQALEKHSGLSLAKFFDQWFHNRGYPKIKAEFSFNEKEKLATITFKQTQIDKDKKIGLFDLDLEIVWEDAEGNLHEELAVMKKETHAITFRAKTDPKQVVIDPEGKVLMKLDFDPGTDKTKRALQQTPSVFTKIWAAKVLASSGKMNNIKAVKEAYVREEHWGTRRAICKALAKSKSQFAVEALTEIIHSEQDPTVLPVVFESAGAYRDPQIRQALLEALESRDLAPFAKTACTVALGKQRNVNDLDLLMQLADDTGFQLYVRAAALKAIGLSRNEDALEFLINRIDYGAEPNLSRASAVEALGQLGQWLKEPLRKRIVSRLIDLSKDRVEPIRMRAARMLSALKASEAIPALYSIKNTVPEQKAVDIQRWINQIAEGDSPSEMTQKQKKRIEDLEETLRKMESRLQKLEEKTEDKEEDDKNGKKQSND